MRDIFKMCMAGKGPSQISKELTRRGIPTPSEHFRSLGISTPAKEPEQPGFWQQRTVADILIKQEYLGHTVNFKTRKKSFKCKKKVWNDPSEWQIFENTHEAIINQETFNIVQRIRDGRRRLTPMGEMPILSGMLFCADCGAKLYQVRARGWTHEQEEHFVCATYRKIKGSCTSHQIHNVQVEGKISDERFARMSASYEDEQKQLEVRKAELAEFIAAAKEQRLNTDSFLGMVRKYTDITELSAVIICSFVEKIEVLQPEKVPGTRTKKQTIVIYWNFIGAVEIPDEQEKTA